MSMDKLMRFVYRCYSPKYLFWTNTVTGAGFLIAGDFIEQQIERRLLKTRTNFDLIRSGSMLPTGVYFGVVGHYWYKFLDTRYSGRAKSTIMKKLGAELAFGPPFSTSVFFSVGLCEGKSMETIWRDIRSNLIFLCLFDWLFYIPLQAINFYWLPTKYRFLFVATISLVYDVFLSYVVHRSDEESNSDKKNDTKTNEKKKS